MSRVHVLYVRDGAGTMFDVPEISFPDTASGKMEACQTSQRFAHYLADGADAPLGAPCVVEDVRQTLESMGINPTTCSVVVMLVDQESGSDAVRTATDGEIVHVESVAEFSLLFYQGVIRV